MMFYEGPIAPEMFEQADIDQNKTLAGLSYLGILFIIPLIAAPNSKFAKFHANQGLILFVLLTALYIVVGIFTTILGLIGIAIGGILGTLIGLFTGLIWFVLPVAGVAFGIYRLIKAMAGEAREIPYVGKYRIIK